MRTLYLAVPLAAVAANLLATIGVVLRTRDPALRRALVLMGCLMAAADLSLPVELIFGSTGTDPVVLNLLRAATFLLPAAVFHSGFECSGGGARHHPAVVWIGYAIGLALAALQLRGLVYRGFRPYQWGELPLPASLFPLVVCFSLVWVGLGILLCVRSLRRPQEAAHRLRAKYWLIGVTCAVPLGCTEVLAYYGWGVLPVWSSRSFFVVGMLLYANARDQLLDLDRLVVKLAGVLVMALIAALPAAGVMIWILHPALHPFASITAGLLTLAAVASVVTLVGLRSHIEEGLESALFPARRAARDALLQFTSNIVKLPCREHLVSEVLSTLTESLLLSGAALYLQERGSGQFILAAAEGDVQSPRHSQIRR